MAGSARRRTKSLIIVVSGGSCSGKTTFAAQFKNATVVAMDHFYKGKARMKPPYNFDEPASVDLEGFYKAVKTLQGGKKAVIPKYNMRLSKPVGKQTLTPRPIIVAEGIFSLHYKPLRELADLMVYIEAPVEERIKRRIKRDVEKGRDLLATLEHSITVEREHQKWVEPQKKFADFILPW
jgi:uridine kinase